MEGTIRGFSCRPRIMPLGRSRLAALALLVIVSVGLLGCARGEKPIEIEIDLRYSRFAPGELHVPVGRPVTFVLRNRDPIDHEWIVGDEATHRRHRTGTEPHHGTRPTEMSVAALSTVRTTITFGGPTTLTFACHLPGHEAFGMVGTLVVEDR